MKLMKVKMKSVPAPLWKRVMAYIIDLLLLNLVVVPPFQKILKKVVPASPSFKESYQFFLNNNVDMQTILLAAFGLVFFSLLYWVLLEYKLGQTVGKIVMNIYVKTKGKEQMITPGQSFLRNLPKISSIFIALDTAYMLYTKTNQRYFEKLSNTEVVEQGWSI
ncbi:RDD family protein [Candidatus Woesearchaeota archaeon]|nr:RDD family protein [Candidatus Woesearchaeota archaeon]